MKTFTVLVAGTGFLVSTGRALAQTQMMQGGMWHANWMGDYGGPWTAIVLIAVVAALVVWIFQRKGK